MGGSKDWTPVRYFNLMFKTFVGPVEDTNSVVIYVPKLRRVFCELPQCAGFCTAENTLGIAQIGKAFRNEINTKYFLFRTREFEQMEMQAVVFCEARLCTLSSLSIGVNSVFSGSWI